MEKIGKENSFRKTPTEQQPSSSGAVSFIDKRPASAAHNQLIAAMQLKPNDVLPYSDETSNQQTAHDNNPQNEPLEHEPAKPSLESHSVAQRKPDHTRQSTSANGSAVIQRNALTKIAQGAVSVVLPPVAFHAWGWSDYKNTVGIYDGVIAQSRANAMGVNLQSQYAQRAKKWEHAKVAMSGFAAWAALTAVVLAGLSFPFTWAVVPSAIAGIVAGVAQVGVGIIERVILGIDQDLKPLLGGTDFNDALIAKVQKEKYTWWLNVLGGLVGAGAGGAGFLGLSPAASAGVLAGERVGAASVEYGSAYRDQAAQHEVNRRHQEQQDLDADAANRVADNRNQILRPANQQPLASIMTGQLKPAQFTVIQRAQESEPESSGAKDKNTVDASNIISDIKKHASAAMGKSQNHVSVLEKAQATLLNVKSLLGELRGSSSKMTTEVEAGTAGMDSASSSFVQGLKAEQEKADVKAGEKQKNLSKDEQSAAFRASSSKVDDAGSGMAEASDKLDVTSPEIEKQATQSVLAKIGSFFGKGLHAFRKFMRSAWQGLAGRLKRLARAGTAIIEAVKAKMTAMVLKLLGIDKDIHSFESDIDESVDATQSAIEGQKKNQEMLKKI